MSRSVQKLRIVVAIMLTGIVRHIQSYTSFCYHVPCKIAVFLSRKTPIWRSARDLLTLMVRGRSNWCLEWREESTVVTNCTWRASIEIFIIVPTSEVSYAFTYEEVIIGRISALLMYSGCQSVPHYCYAITQSKVGFNIYDGFFAPPLLCLRTHRRRGMQIFGSHTQRTHGTRPCGPLDPTIWRLLTFDIWNEMV